MIEVLCPKCKSNHVRRSRTRGIKERLLKRLGWRAYRCREKNCRWRGLIQTELTRDIIKALMLDHKPAIIGLGIAAGIIIFFMSLLLFCME